MKKLIAVIALLVIFASAAFTPAHADGIAGTLQVTCDNWTRTYTMTVGTWAADMNVWNSQTLSYGCFLTGHSVADGYKLNMYETEIGWKSGIYATSFSITR